MSRLVRCGRLGFGASILLLATSASALSADAEKSENPSLRAGLWQGEILAVLPHCPDWAFDEQAFSARMTKLGAKLSPADPDFKAGLEKGAAGGAEYVKMFSKNRDFANLTCQMLDVYGPKSDDPERRGLVKRK